MKREEGEEKIDKETLKPSLKNQHRYKANNYEMYYLILIKGLSFD